MKFSAGMVLAKGNSHTKCLSGAPKDSPLGVLSWDLSVPSWEQKLFMAEPRLVLVAGQAGQRRVRPALRLQFPFFP